MGIAELRFTQECYIETGTAASSSLEGRGYGGTCGEWSARRGNGKISRRNDRCSLAGSYKSHRPKSTVVKY